MSIFSSYKHTDLFAADTDFTINIRHSDDPVHESQFADELERNLEQVMKVKYPPHNRTSAFIRAFMETLKTCHKLNVSIKRSVNGRYTMSSMRGEEDNNEFELEHYLGRFEKHLRNLNSKLPDRILWIGKQFMHKPLGQWSRSVGYKFPERYPVQWNEDLRCFRDHYQILDNSQCVLVEEEMIFCASTNQHILKYLCQDKETSLKIRSVLQSHDFKNYISNWMKEEACDNVDDDDDVEMNLIMRQVMSFDGIILNSKCNMSRYIFLGHGYNIITCHLWPTYGWKVHTSNESNNTKYIADVMDTELLFTVRCHLHQHVLLEGKSIIIYNDADMM